MEVPLLTCLAYRGDYFISEDQCSSLVDGVMRDLGDYRPCFPVFVLPTKGNQIIELLSCGGELYEVLKVVHP